MLAIRILVAAFAVVPLVAPAGFAALGFVLAGGSPATISAPRCRSGPPARSPCPC
jgi:hypothetical protein